ncbi:hypothetical protein TKK_0009293 [Trichogramma kaykai]
MEAYMAVDLRQVSAHTIELWVDKNHSVKAFSNSLYGMSLPKPIIDYFNYLMTNSIIEHKNNSDEQSEKLKSLVPHAFGDHSLCTFHENEEEYEYKRLPGKKPLESLSLRNSLDELMQRYVNNAEKLSPAASTQANESFNNTVASKNPKSRHYSGSESFNFRVAAAVCQKNIGNTYVDRVFTKLQLSPLKTGLSQREMKDRKMQKRKLFAAGRDGKIRRRFLKNKRASETTRKHRNEGMTYESDVGLSGVLDLPLEKIVSPIIAPFEEIKRFKLVYFDTETIGLGPTDQIIQVALSDGDNLQRLFGSNCSDQSHSFRKNWA